ncbi:MAG: sigma 54-interacting transcriptional regulator [Deltaproteobacteria bacterium]|nr:sigma 54-interacting transcriptional regulator [Deltaproteobacteria bacterium]
MIVLEVLDGRSRGLRLEAERQDTYIGRAQGCDLVLADEHVSWRHARVVQGIDGVTIEDLGSTNGTAVVRATSRTELGDEAALALSTGDVIELGSGAQVCRLRLTIAEPERVAQVVTVKRVAEVGGATSAVEGDPQRLQALYRAESQIGRAAGLDDVLAAIAEAALALVPSATHVTLVLRDDDAALRPGGGEPGTATGTYLPVLSRARCGSPAPPGEPAPVPRSIFRKALAERAAVLFADAPKEVGTSASILGASVRSTAAVPLWRGDEILGVLQVDNRDAPGMLKPRDLDILLVLAEHASLAVAGARLVKRLVVAEERLRSENRYLKGRAERLRGGAAGEAEDPAGAIIGRSPPMLRLLGELDKVVDTRVTVLIEGETGTGKELVASAIHSRSRRRDRLFVAQNCAALSESLLESELFGHKRGSFTGAIEDKKGLFEIADGSTLFLDEIAEAPPAIQSKLLRALQEGEIRPVGATESKRVNVRVVAATNRDLEAEVAAGRFREDLYYRLRVFPLRVPPLRERRGDIALLVQHLLDRYGRELAKPVAGVVPEAMGLLEAYDWPGNVRELQNEVQRLVIQLDPGAFVTPESLSPRLRRAERLVAAAGGAKGTLRETLDAVEKHLLVEALRAQGGSKTAAARSLGITREGLHKKLRQFGM